MLKVSTVLLSCGLFSFLERTLAFSFFRTMSDILYNISAIADLLLFPTVLKANFGKLENKSQQTKPLHTFDKHANILQTAVRNTFTTPSRRVAGPQLGRHRHHPESHSSVRRPARRGDLRVPRLGAPWPLKPRRQTLRPPKVAIRLKSYSSMLSVRLR